MSVSSGVDTRGWKQIDAGDFTFRLPPEYRRAPASGIESQVPRWIGGRKALSYELGPFASTLKEAKAHLEEYSESHESIGGHPTTIVSGFDSKGNWGDTGVKHVVAATWRNIRPGLHLMLNATTEDAGDLAVQFAIVRSVKFRT